MLAGVARGQQLTNQPSRLSPIVVEAPAISVQQTPSAVTVLSAPSDTGARTLYDLGAFAPNLRLTPSPSRAFGDVQTLRGVGNTQFFSSPALAMYVDDVPMGSVMTFPMDLLQIERIELWRGPQGAAFGQNNEAGVLNIVSRRATNRTEAFADASYGTYNEQVYRAGVMGPIIKDKLFYAIAGEFSHLDGFLDNPTLHTHPDKQEGWNGRFSLAWTPTADWDISLTLAGEKRDDGVRIAPLGGDLFRAPAPSDPFARSDSNTESLRIVRAFDNFSITTITSRRGYSLDPLFLDFRDPSYALWPNTVQLARHYESWSQELRLQSLNVTAPWQWRGGFFFSTTRQQGEDTRAYFPGPTRVTNFTLDDDNYALYGQLTYAGCDKLTITLGTRLDYTVRGIDRNQTFAAPLQAHKGVFNAAPKITLAYQFTTNLLAYASTGVGFKPGGYSAYMDPPVSSEFGTERNWANELGLKTTWLDGKLLANVALFYNYIRDYQVELMNLFTGDLSVYNADRVTTCGAELELIARPMRGLELTAAAGYTHAEFDRFTNPLTLANLDGRTPPYIPNITATLAAQYKAPCGFLGRLEYQLTGHTYYDEANTAAASESAYGLLNARLGYEARYWGVYLYGRNLTDTGYRARIIPASNSIVPGDPRTLGVMLSARY